MAKNLLSQPELDRLVGVIAETERKTSGELRLMIVGRSSSTAHVFPLLSFALATLAMLALWHFRYHFVLELEAWRMVGLLLAAAMFGGWLLSRFSFVQRVFTPNLDDEVFTRAELEFHRQGMGATSGRTGILIFLSLLEHRVVVLGDRAINAKIAQGTWEEVVSLVLAPGRSWPERLENAIRRCGDLLSVHFPVGPGDKNELPDLIIVKD